MVTTKKVVIFFRARKVHPQRKSSWLRLYGFWVSVVDPAAGLLSPHYQTPLETFLYVSSNRWCVCTTWCVWLVHSDHYITLVRWRDDEHLLVAWSNRLQNKTYVTVCHAVSTDCHLVICFPLSLSLSLCLSLCLSVYLSVCLAVCALSVIISRPTRHDTRVTHVSRQDFVVLLSNLYG